MRVQQWLHPFWICDRDPSTKINSQPSMSNRCPALTLMLGLSLVLLLTSCQASSSPPPRQIVLEQSWELKPGDRIGGYLVTASLGDVSIYLKGNALRAPFDGEVELAAAGVHCVYFSTSEIPAYLFRFCGLRRPRLGTVDAGDVIGSGEYVYFATLRRQPEGAWAIVEPSSSVLERALQYHE